MLDSHTSPNNKKFEISQQFKDDRYKELAIRIIYEVAPHTLPEQEKRNYELEIQEKFNDDDKAKWNSKNTNKIHESADVIYHLFVYLEANNIKIEDVMSELKKRQK